MALSALCFNKIALATDFGTLKTAHDEEAQTPLGGYCIK